MTALALALAVAAGAAVAGGAAAATAAPVSAHKAAPCDAWGGAGLSYSGALTSVVAFSPCDVWAAGYQGQHSLLVHWNGRAWTLIRSGVVISDDPEQPVAIGGTSDRDIWLATMNSKDRPVVEHWNGTRFSRVAVPLPADAIGPTLASISAVSRTDVWAAGWASPAGGGPSYTLVEHWNGRAWSIAASADPSRPSGQFIGSSDNLYGVSAHGGAAWAVGTFFDGVIDGQSTLIEQWNGHAWVWVKSPDAARENQLNAVSADSPSDAWAVGFDGGLANVGLVEHWNGTTWRSVAFPNPGRDGKDRPSAILTGVSALSPDDVWVCGTYPVPGGQLRTLLAHWNGASWQQISTPASVKLSNVLNAVSAAGPDDIWSVGGTTTVKGVQQPIALHHG